MKPASRARTLALVLLVLDFATPGAPVDAQDVCPRASGPDAEAGWTAYSANDMTEARSRFVAALARCSNDQYARTGLGYVWLSPASCPARQAGPTSFDGLAGNGF